MVEGNLSSEESRKEKQLNPALKNQRWRKIYWEKMSPFSFLAYFKKMKVGLSKHQSVCSH
jgi:hypothetical protein